MEDGQENDANDKLPFYGDHRFLAMIIMSVIVANILIVISMMLYSQSGASQLDLSRPGYKDVRAKIVSKDDSFSNFSASGEITSSADTAIKEATLMIDVIMTKPAKNFLFIFICFMALID